MHLGRSGEQATNPPVIELADDVLDRAPFVGLRARDTGPKVAAHVRHRPEPAPGRQRHGTSGLTVRRRAGRRSAALTERLASAGDGDATY